ncbi:hypothetical protein K443DRAFT_130862 [Laccaria amethystina LaAM-08-1]|uniref:Uncharacterized protein n=1 Tax=Laccaria amethystina LaAM-08-1 TaxID=1095629 RepID=A0A0C9WXB4_9AGAR|nr:hypothetical protein K443DRAFT_130862 [Laccaria amethystina LaAM-08-1]
MAPAPDPYYSPTPVNHALPIDFQYHHDGLESLTAPHFTDSPLSASAPQEIPSLDSSPSPASPTQAALPNAKSARPSLPAPILKDGLVDSGGVTTFTTQHPFKDVQPPRFRVRQSKSDTVKLDQAERKKLREKKAEELKEGVGAIIKSQDVSIKVLAEQLSFPEKTIQTLVNGVTHYVKHRKPSVYNALVHKAKAELNDDLPIGKWLKLKEIQESVRASMNSNMFSEDYKTEALLELEEDRKIKTMGLRSGNTAAHADARATTSSLTDEVLGLGIHIHDDFVDTIVEFNGSSTFFLNVFNMHPTDVCSRFQQWVCNQKISLEAPGNLQAAQAECVVMIKNGLHKFPMNPTSLSSNASCIAATSGIPNLGMNYINYRTSIQQKHHVELLGWPVNIPFANPHHITTVAMARKLQKALSVATCKWVIMTKRRIREHAAELALDVKGGSVVGKKCKARSDRGKKQKHATVTEEGAEEEDGDGIEGEVEDPDEEEEDDAPSPAMKKKAAAPVKKPKAVATKSQATTTAKAANAAKKAKRVARALPPVAPKTKEFFNSNSDESD